jgi:CelD/BcsL family acetyltransferase involved in cellulose biosynthesis
VEWEIGPDALERAGAEWDGLAGRHVDPFMRREWLAPWLQAFARPEECALCLVRRDGTLVGAAPFLRSGRRLLGMANLHTPVFRPMASDAGALEALTVAIADASAGALTIGPLPDGEEAKALTDGARRAGRLVAVERRYESPLAETAGGDLDAYRRSRGNTWKDLERKMRRASREHEVKLRLLCAADDKLAFLEEGLSLEGSGWKGGAGTAILSSAQTARFYRDMAAGYARRGELWLSGMWFDGSLVAFDLALNFGGRYWGLKSAYDERERKVSPGLLLARATIEESFRQGLVGFEMLGSSARYKDMFATSHRRHLTVSAYRRTPTWTPVWAWRRTRPHAKRLYRRAVALRERAR